MPRVMKVVALGDREPDKGGRRIVCNHDAFANNSRGYLVPGRVTEVYADEFFGDIKSGDVLVADEETAKRARQKGINVTFDQAAVDALVKLETEKLEKADAEAEKIRKAQFEPKSEAEEVAAAPVVKPTGQVPANKKLAHGAE